MSQDDNYGLMRPAFSTEARRSPLHADQAQVDISQTKDLIYMAIKHCQTIYDRWFQSWKQKNNERCRIEPNAFKLEERNCSTFLVCTDGTRAEFRQIPDGTRQLFEIILAIPLNNLVTIVDRYDPRLTALANIYLAKKVSPQ